MELLQDYAYNHTIETNINLTRKWREHSNRRHKNLKSLRGHEIIFINLHQNVLVDIKFSSYPKLLCPQKKNYYKAKIKTELQHSTNNKQTPLKKL